MRGNRLVWIVVIFLGLRPLLGMSQPPGKSTAAVPLSRLGLANAFYGQRDYNRAATEYRAAVQQWPKSVAARTGLAHSFAGNRDYRSARTHYEAALTLQPDYLNAILGLGVVAYRQGKPDEASHHFEQISHLLEPANPDHADAFLHQGLLALVKARYDTARQMLDIAARLRPDDPSALLGLSEVFRRQDLYGQALELLQQAIAKTVDPQGPKATEPIRRTAQLTRGRMLANQGSLLLKLNMISRAYPVFQEALKNDPRNLNALNGVAVSLLETDQLAKANALYDSILARGNQKPFLLNNRGIVRAYTAMQRDRDNQPEQAQQLYQRAKTDFEKAQKLDTTRRFYQNNLGNALKNLGQYDEAIKSYQAYLSKSAINNIGVLYAANKKPDFARYYLNLAIELDSTNLVFRYNRLTLYRAFFADSLAQNPKLLATDGQLPTSSISAKYSRDGYVNMYLYDYDFDAYTYPANHHFPIEPEIPPTPASVSLTDSVARPKPGPPVSKTLLSPPSALSAAAVAPAPIGVAPKPAVSATPHKRARMPKPAKARRSARWGSTRCPVF